MKVISPLSIRFTTDWKMQRWNMQIYQDNLVKRVANHPAWEASGGQKQVAVVVNLTDHQRRKLWKRKPKQLS